MIMERYLVNYTESAIRKIVVTADSAEEAERMVMRGDVDYDESDFVDCDIVCVNDVQKV